MTVIPHGGAALSAAVNDYLPHYIRREVAERDDIRLGLVFVERLFAKTVASDTVRFPVKPRRVDLIVVLFHGTPFRDRSSRSKFTASR